MQPDLIILVITGLVTALGTMGGVMIIVTKKLNDAPQSNGRKRFDNGIQKQMDKSDETAVSLSTRFDAQVRDCNARWLLGAHNDGKIDAYMAEIRDRLTKIENR